MGEERCGVVSCCGGGGKKKAEVLVLRAGVLRKWLEWKYEVESQGSKIKRQKARRDEGRKDG